MEKKNKKTEARGNCELPKEAFIKHEPLPKLNKLALRKEVWFFLTCWRPLFKYETRKYNIMIIRLSQAIINLKVVQEKLIKNNNAMMQQLQGRAMVDASKKEEEAKRAEMDISFQ